jgi:hypothetical protein
MNDEVLIALGRLEGKMDAMMVSLRAQEAELKKLEERIRELENNRAWMLGAAAVISVIAGLIVRTIK